MRVYWLNCKNSILDMFWNSIFNNVEIMLRPATAFATGCAITVPAVEQGSKLAVGVKAISALNMFEEPVQKDCSKSTSSAGAVPARTTAHEDASRFCPVCSQRLESWRCKLVCNLCGYYMSCADYY